MFLWDRNESEELRNFSRDICGRSSWQSLEVVRKGTSPNLEGSDAELFLSRSTMSMYDERGRLKGRGPNYESRFSYIITSHRCSSANIPGQCNYGQGYFNINPRQTSSHQYTTRLSSQVSSLWRALIINAPILWAKFIDYFLHQAGDWWRDEAILRTRDSALPVKGDISFKKTAHLHGRPWWLNFLKYKLAKDP